MMKRRTVLRGMAALAAMPAAAAPASILRGLFPIAQTPFTPDDRLDLKALAEQVRFCTRTGVPGLIWPQLASNWEVLNEPERMNGAEALLAAARGTPTAVVIGVQDRNGDLEASLRLARHAQAHGAPAVISLPPEKAGEDAMVAYYKAIGAATPLPLVLQTQGSMSVELVGKVYRAAPTLACVKDEAGDPLQRYATIRTLTEGKVAIFAGKGCTEMLNELTLGFDGYCPSMFCTDLFQRVFEMWHAGRKRPAEELFARILALRSIPNVMPYLMVLRGIFPESATTRPVPGRKPPVALTDGEKQLVRAIWNDLLAPYART
jgi:dihydrodipicolinate synthase/N-acetylneuraminate lyase